MTIEEACPECVCPQDPCVEGEQRGSHVCRKNAMAATFRLNYGIVSPQPLSAEEAKAKRPGFSNG